MIAYPTPKQLQYFIHVATTGSFTKAAKLCNVTQSTLSAGIQELETLLGAPLFERQGRKTAISALGEELLPQAQTILNNMADMTKIAQIGQKPLSGPIRMGVIPTIAPYLLPSLLPHLSQEYTNLNLRLKEDLSENLANSLMSGKLDMAVTALPNDKHNDLDMIAITEEAFYLALPASIAPKQRSIKSQDLTRYRLMLLEEGHCLRDQALNACHLRARNTDKQFSASSLQTLVQLVHEGYGATIIPQMALAKGITHGLNIKCYAITDPTPTRQIGIAIPKHSRFKSDAQRIANDIQMILNDDLTKKDPLASDNHEHNVQHHLQVM